MLGGFQTYTNRWPSRSLHSSLETGIRAARLLLGKPAQMITNLLTDLYFGALHANNCVQNSSQHRVRQQLVSLFCARKGGEPPELSGKSTPGALQRECSSSEADLSDFRLACFSRCPNLSFTEPSMSSFHADQSAFEPSEPPKPGSKIGGSAHSVNQRRVSSTRV